MTDDIVACYLPSPIPSPFLTISINYLKAGKKAQPASMFFLEPEKEAILLNLENK